MRPGRTAILGALISGMALTACLAPAAHAAESTTTTSSTTSTTTTSTVPPTTSTTTSTSTSTSSPAATTSTRPPPPKPKTDPDAFAALANQVSQNQSLLTQLSGQVAQSTLRLTQLATEITETQQKLDAARADMARLRTILRGRAAYIYQHAHAPDVAVVDIQHVEDITTGKKYAESAAQTDGSRITDLTHVSDQLDAHRKELESARSEQQHEKDRLEEAQAGLEALTANQKKLLDEAGAIPVMGDAELTAAEITDWFDARDVKYHLADGMSIADLIKIYMEEGKAEHVRPELAFAQSIIETGSFGSALDSNYAGIGACDSCKGEPAFPTPRDGVRGQIQLLRNYADPTSRAANLANPPSPTIYGNDPAAAARSYDTFFAKGTTPTWNVMGNGNWATDPGYSEAVLTIYFQMVSYAAKHS